MFDALSTTLTGFPGPSADQGALSLEETARMVGAYRWIERRLFQIYGHWVGQETVPEARLFYDVQSQQHAWHAELWEERLPVLDSVDPDALSAAPSEGVDRLLARVAGGGHVDVDPAGPAVSEVGPGSTGGSGGTLLRLVGMARVVLPRLVAGYTRHLHRSVMVADAPVIRALRHVVRDEMEAWQAAELQVQVLVRRPSDVAAVTEHQRASWRTSWPATAPALVPWPARPE